MKKLLLPAALSLLLSFTVVPTAHAAGGGGGGSVPTCTQDTWGCTDWGECSTAGKQTRTCVLSFDCPNLDTPKPATEQSCTPPAPPAPSPTASLTTAPAVTTPASQPATAPSPTPSVAIKEKVPEKKPAAPNCKADEWKCGDWSACDLDGNQKKSCKKVVDCAATDTPEPLGIRRCDHLQCGNKATVKERIMCRIGLSPAGVARELEIQYLPELCRAEKDKTEQKECIERYKSYQPCWQLPVGDARLECAKKALKWGPAISEQVKECQGKTGAAQVECKKDVKEKVLYLITFRMYDLEQRAEDLVLKGAPQNIVTDFDILIETKKQEFHEAKTKAEHVRIINEVQEAWRQFVASVKDSIK